MVIPYICLVGSFKNRQNLSYALSYICPALESSNHTEDYTYKK